MPDDTAKRFARIILSELADIHALLFCIADSQLNEAACHPDEAVDEAARNRMLQRIDAKRKEHRKEIYDMLMKRLDLPE